MTQRWTAEERRAELVVATLRVMTRDGVAGATTRAVVREAGMTLGAYHYCFASKRDLFRRVIETVVAEEVAAGLSAVRGGGDVRASLHEALTGYWEFVTADPGRHQAVYELTLYALRTPGEEELARLHHARWRQAAEEVLGCVGEAAGVAWRVPVPMAARWMVAALDGLTLAWLADRDTDAARSTLAMTADQLAALADKRPGACDRAAG